MIGKIGLFFISQRKEVREKRLVFYADLLKNERGGSHEESRCFSSSCGVF